jgi:hypothetical protein
VRVVTHEIQYEFFNKNKNLKAAVGFCNLGTEVYEKSFEITHLRKALRLRKPFSYVTHFNSVAQRSDPNENEIKTWQKRRG